MEIWLQRSVNKLLFFSALDEKEDIQYKHSIYDKG